MLGAFGLTAAMCRSGRAAAPDWPARTIKVVVGGSAGSVPDTLARLAAAALAETLGQSIIIENRPGAAGIVAMHAIVSSAPDGYTLGLATISQAVFNSYLYRKLSYDPRRDLLPVSTLATSASVLVAHPGVQANSLAELVALSKQEPSKLLIGIPASGSPPHIAALLLLRETGLSASFVPFRSGPDAVQGALRGDIQLLVDGPTLLAPQVAEGRLKAFVFMGHERTAILRDVPTIAEAGFGSATAESWLGLVAPRDTPTAIVEALSRATRTITAKSEYRDALERISMRPTASTPEAFATLIAQEHQHWSPLLSAANLKLD